MATTTQTLETILRLKDELSSGAKAAAGSLSATDAAASKAQASLDALASRYAIAGRQADVLREELNQLNAKYGEGSLQSEKKEIALQRLAATMGQIPQKAQAVVSAFEREAAAAQAATEAEERKAAAAQRLIASQDALAAATTRNAQSLEQLGQASSTLDDVNAGMSKLGTAIGVVGAVGGAATAVKEFVTAGQGVNAVTQSFQNLAAASGTTGDVLLGKLKSASKGYIDDVTLMTSANQALIIGGADIADKLPKFLEIAAASAKATNSDISQSYASLLEGALKGSTELLDNIGITFKAEEAYQRYAESIGKTVTQLTDQEKKQATLNEILLQGQSLIDRVGESSDRGTDAILRFNAEFTNLTTTIQGFAAIGFTDVIAGGNLVLEETSRLALEVGANYQTYAAAIDAANASGGTQAVVLDGLLDVLDPFNIITGELGENTVALSEAQYNAAMAFEATGMAAGDAAAAGTELGTAIETVQSAAIDATMTEEEMIAVQEELAAMMLEVATASDDNGAAVIELAEQFGEGLISAEDFRAGLDELSSGYIDNDLEANRLVISTQMVADAQYAAEAASYAASDGLYNLTDAQIEQISASLEAETRAEMLGTAQYNLEQASYAAEGGAFAEAVAVAQLAQKFDIATDKAAQLINMQQQLNDVLAGKTVRAITARAVRTATVDTTAYVREVEQAQRKAARGGGGGRSAGGRSATPSRSSAGSRSATPKRTEAQKAAEKELKDREKAMEKEQKALEKAQEKIAKTRADHLEKMAAMDKAHTEKAQAIWDDFYEKQKAATDKFNSDKFDTELGFRESLKGMDAAQRAALIQQERAAWDESQRIAQAGNAKLADDYYQASLEIIAANQERAEELAALEREITEAADEETAARLQAELAYQQQLDADMDRREAERLQALKDSGNELEQERDAQLAEENEDFNESRQELVTDFEKSIQEIIASQDAAVAAQLSYEAAVVTSFTTITAAVNSAIAALGGIPAPGGGAAPASVPQYATGTGDRGLSANTLLWGHAGEIISDPATSDRIRAAGGMEHLLSMASRPIPTISSGGGTSTTSYGGASVVFEAGAFVFPAGAQVTPGQVQAWVDTSVRAALAQSGLAASRRIRGG